MSILSVKLQSPTSSSKLRTGTMTISEENTPEPLHEDLACYEFLLRVQTQSAKIYVGDPDMIHGQGLDCVGPANAETDPSQHVGWTASNLEDVYVSGPAGAVIQYSYMSYP
jgi:hypothetical protein